MKVVVIGAAGEVGKALTADLVCCPEIDHIVAADVAPGTLRALAEGTDRVSAARLDLHDREQALRILDGCDLLVNCTSFALFDEVIDLAVTAGIDYADLISEPSDEQARAVEEAGITAISGLGLTPGLSNVLVAHAADELGEIEEANIAWMSFRTIAPSRGLLDTILWELSEGCRTREYFQSGRFHPRARWRARGWSTSHRPVAPNVSTSYRIRRSGRCPGIFRLSPPVRSAARGDQSSWQT